MAVKLLLWLLFVSVVMPAPAAAASCDAIARRAAWQIHSADRPRPATVPVIPISFLDVQRSITNLRSAIATMQKAPRACRSTVQGYLDNAYQLLVVAYIQAGRANDARVVFAEAVKGDRDIGSVNALVRRGKSRGAFERLNGNVNSFAGNTWTFSASVSDRGADKAIYSGLTAGAKGNFAQAFRDFRRAVSLSPDLQEPRYFLGLAALAIGDRATAREELIWAIRCYDPNPEGSPGSIYVASAMDLLRDLL